MASQIRALYRMAPAAVVALSLGYATTPARAGDDGQGSFFSSVWGMVGGTIGVENTAPPAINYRERAPLVLPPKMDLPKPAPSIASRSQAWPQDPDLLAAKKAADTSRAPVHPSGPLDPPMSIAESRQRGSLDPTGNQPSDDCLETRTCDPNAFWSMLRNTKKNDSQKLALIPGQEPPREYLTQPPPGFMSPTKAVKLVQSAPHNYDPENNPEDKPAVYFRDQKESQYSPN